MTQAETSKVLKVVPERHLNCRFMPFVTKTKSDAVHAGDIVTQAETSKLLKVVPERHLDCPCTAFVTKTRSALHTVPQGRTVMLCRRHCDPGRDQQAAEGGA